MATFMVSMTVETADDDVDSSLVEQAIRDGLGGQLANRELAGVRRMRASIRGTLNALWCRLSVRKRRAYTEDMADRRRLTCSCGRWRGYTDTDMDAQRLAAEHGRERGPHVVKIESRDDYRRRSVAARPQHPRSI